MKLSPSDEQRMIRDAAREFLADASDSAAVRRCVESGQGFDADVWQRIAGELGWCAVGLPEECDGMGADALAQALMFEAAGEYLLCAPWFGTAALAANLIEATSGGDARTELLGAIARGELSASTPLPSHTDWLCAADELIAARDGDGWRLHGRAPRVPEGARVDLLLLFARIEGGETGLFAVTGDAGGLSRVAHTGFDATRRFAEVRCTGTSARRVDGAGRLAAGLSRAAARARLCIAAEQLGGAQRCLDLTVAYVAERRQFGRAIASFQAVKHRCAEMMVRIEAARSAVYGAAAAVNAGDAQAQQDCAAARLLANEAFFFCAQEAIQLHGGVGFTWEYDPQLYFKRAQASHHWLGTPDALCEQLAGALLDGREAA